MLKTKFIAIYFPQFYETEENNAWWGDGFTDWVNVKNAKPLFKGHSQPKLPLDCNFYDQSKVETLRNQVKLAKAYGIDGFCFYHYWFDGKLILEKPLENFLNNKDIEMPFCLSWANESWTKRWVGDSKTVLLKQTHKEDIEIWESHFQYLLPFWKDRRAILKDGKPIFIIYQPNIIPNTKDLFAYWEKRAKEEGLEGIFFIATKRYDFIKSDFLNAYDGIMKFQPQNAYNSKNYSGKSFFSSNLFQLFRIFPERVIDYFHYYRKKIETYKIHNSKLIWKVILEEANEKQDGLTVYESAYVNWDNTPRYGNKATIFSEITPDEFGDYLYELVLKRKNTSNDKDDLIFINAWNEWAEGAYLEPDTKNGYKFLEAIKAVKTRLSQMQV